MVEHKINPEYEETFYILPRRIRKISGITQAFMDVYETIFQFWNKQLPCFLTNKTIEDRTGVGHSQARAALAFFESNGELERKVINGRRYLVQPVRKIETDCSDNLDAAPPAPPCRSSGTPPAAPPAHNIKKDSNKEINTTTSEDDLNKDLIRLRDKHLPTDPRPNEEFLKQCHFHIDNGGKSYTRAQKIAGLKILIAK